MGGQTLHVAGNSLGHWSSSLCTTVPASKADYLQHVLALFRKSRSRGKLLDKPMTMVVQPVSLEKSSTALGVESMPAKSLQKSQVSGEQDNQQSKDSDQIAKASCCHVSP